MTGRTSTLPPGMGILRAQAIGVEYGPLPDDERQRLLVDIDAYIAFDWGLDEQDLDTIFEDFTLDAVSPDYRDELRDRLRELNATS